MLSALAEGAGGAEGWDFQCFYLGGRFLDASAPLAMEAMANTRRNAKLSLPFFAPFLVATNF